MLPLVDVVNAGFRGARTHLDGRSLGHREANRLVAIGTTDVAPWDFRIDLVIRGEPGRANKEGTGVGLLPDVIAVVIGAGALTQRDDPFVGVVQQDYGGGFA